MIRNRLQLRVGVVPSSQLHGLLPCTPSTEPQKNNSCPSAASISARADPRILCCGTRVRTHVRSQPTSPGVRTEQAEGTGARKRAEMTTMALTLDAIARPGAESTGREAQTPGRGPAGWGPRWGCGQRRRGHWATLGLDRQAGPLLQLQAHSPLLTPESRASSRPPLQSLPTAWSAAAPRDLGFKTLHPALNSEKTTPGHLKCVLQLGLP